jgi:ribosomal protein L21E
MARKKKTAYQKKISKVMDEYGKGALHSGKGGPVVKSRKQAIAIAISSAKKVKRKK